MTDERTLLVIKPDGVKEALIGEISQRIEKAGLTIVTRKITRPSRKLIEEFLNGNVQWLIGMGEKALINFADARMDSVETFGTNDPLEIGRMVKEWLIEFWLSGSVVPMIISGSDAIARVRELIGNTIPANAKAGTIRGDFSRDSPRIANAEHRCMHNIVHASGTREEAEREIKIWFPEWELNI